MAVYYTDLSRSFGKTVGHGDAARKCTAVAIVALTTAMIDNANDEVGLFWLPKGAIVTGVTAYCTDIDTNGSPAVVIDIGDDSDEDRLVAASTIGQAGTLTTTIVPSTGFLYKYTSKTLIKAYIATASATGAAGTLKVMVDYLLDPEYDTTALTASTTT